jgi:hypothetical protein
MKLFESKLKEAKQPKYEVGDTVLVNTGYKDEPFVITGDFTDWKLYAGDKNGYEMKGLGDRIRPEQIVKLVKKGKK